MKNSLSSATFHGPVASLFTTLLMAASLSMGCSTEPGKEIRDAFPKYNELFADGVYDIAVHFGGDYNEERFDLDTAKWLVEMLLEDGWSNESVASFEDLAIDSPPFTQTVVVEGKEVEVQVYIYHSDMVTSDEEHLLSDAMKTSLAKRDVVIYSGHAGSVDPPVA